MSTAPIVIRPPSHGAAGFSANGGRRPSGTVAILNNAAAAGTTLLKFTTGAAAGADINATNSKMDIGIVKDSTADTTIKSGDTVGLIASVNMSAADYALVTAGLRRFRSGWGRRLKKYSRL